MKAAFRMWKNTRMIILAAVCAAIYGAALIAFKTAIPLIPGVTEVRIANIFPMVFGMLFGPAGAWGTGMGNLVGDTFGGTLGPTSIPGFVGNFLLGYLPYTMWTTFVPLAKKSPHWEAGSWRNWINYFLLGFISSAACAVVVSIAADALGIEPYVVLTKIITLNDTIASWIGLLLFISVYGVTEKQLGLVWTDVMDESDIGSPVAGPAGAWLVATASVFGLVGEVITGISPTSVGWISTLAIIVGSLLL